uniref:Equilibrative nucleoside transporter 3 n=1 Tax=Parascaris univalens TaxID=6257 RepID=A0A914ZZD0_PARUN
MMLHGIGILIPWSSFITIAVEYYVCFKLRKPTPHGGEETPYARDFLKYLATASQGPNLLLNMLNLFFTFGDGLATRIFVCIIIVCVICAITMAFIFVDTSSWINGFFWLTVVLVVLLNAANGVYQNSLFGIAADLPPNVTASIMIGNNICGVFCAIVAIITRAASTTPEASAMAYFSVSLLLMIACGFSFMLLRRSAFYQYYVNKVGKEKRKNGTSKEIQDDSGKRTTEKIFDKLSDYYEVMQTGGIQLLNVWLVLFVTLAVFPAIQAEVRPRDDFIVPKEYFELITSFFSFGFFAMCGAMLSGWIHWPSPRSLVVAAALRLIFIPFFLACNYRPMTRRWPVLIANEWAFIVGGALLAFVSGHFASLAMTYAPRVVAPSKSRSAGMLAAFFLVIGLCSGIATTYLEAYIMENLGPIKPLKLGDATGDMCAAFNKTA